jgi:two-component system, cell cycle response regulator
MSECVKNVEICEGIYWVGTQDEDGALNCNPYLLVEGEEAVLFDPGSVLDIEQVYRNVLEIVPLEKIKYVVLHHQDPDFCSGVPFLEKQGGNFKIVTHWRTQTIIKYYGIKSSYYLVDENNFTLTLKSGRNLKFIMTPYLHFPGAIATYEDKSQILFSSDLFGALSFNRGLYAGEDYLERMKAFHEHYMPSNDIIRPVMEVFMKMDIKQIAPQHGAIIREDVKKYIRVLRDLECGVFLSPIKKSIAEAGGYGPIFSIIINRYCSIFNREEVLEMLKDLEVEIDDKTLELTDYNYAGKDLWNLLFETFYIKKGIKWITVIEPLVQKLSNEYELAMPEVFKSTLKKAEEDSQVLSEENRRLKELTDRLNKSIAETEEKLIKCPTTGLYNDEFFKVYLTTELSSTNEEGSGFNPVLMVIGIDNMAKFRFSYGDNEVEQIFKSLVYLLNELKEDNGTLFRLQGATFAYYLPDATKQSAVKAAEKLRNAVEMSEMFIVKTSVSIGVVSLDEVKDSLSFMDRPAEFVKDIAMMRLKIAREMGMNLVCSNSEVMSYQDNLGKVLIADTDPVNIDVLKTFLENMNYQVITAANGEELLLLAEREYPNIIISEIMLPKLDGFLVRERLLAQSSTKNTPFIIMSHLKNEDSVQRAIALNMDYYFKKPYMLSELLGVIKNKVKGEHANVL